MSKHETLNRRLPIQHAATSPYRFGVLRALLAVFLASSLFVVTTSVFVYNALANQVKKSVLDISHLSADSEQSAEKITPIDQFEGQPINLLVSGVDSRYNQDDSGYGDAEELSTIQSDTTMIAHISADRQSVTVVSIPRDLITDIPSCTLSSGAQTYEYTGMFNSAFSTGAVTNDLAGGIACTKATVEELTGVHIDAFVIVDFTGFKGMIDALGGVWFDVPEDMYDELAGLDVHAGCQRFDSMTALAFARARKEIGDGSDISRIGRQQELVSAMLREVLSKNFVTDLPALLSFLQATIASLTVSPNLADINSDAGLLLSLLNLDKANIRFVTLPWANAPHDPNRVVAVEPDASLLWEVLKSDAPLPAGMTYTDGTGTQQVVPFPGESEPESDPSQTGDSSGDSQTDPSQPPADSSAAEASSPEPAPAPPKTCPPSQ